MRRGQGDSSKKSLQHILNHENPYLGAEGDMKKVREGQLHDISTSFM